MFDVGKDSDAPLNIVFNCQSKELEFYNVSTNKILNSKPQSTMPLQINENGTMDFTLMIDDSVAVLYVNNEAVLSTRMFTMQKNKWGIFSMDSDVTFGNVKLAK